MIPDISVVCPCYNEEENVELIAAAVIAELDKAGASYEFIFIDNASTDRTVEIVKVLCARDPGIKLIVNTRNFGQMRSPTHCIYQTSGRAVLGIAADFQDPPGLIGELIERWRQGWPIVLGVREEEQSSARVALVRKYGYGFLGRIGDVKIIPGATGFGIYDQKVVQVLKRWNEPEPFFRSMLVESGFPIAIVPHKRGPRLRGESSNTFIPALNFAVSALSGSAKRLLRVPIYVGLISYLVVAATLVGAMLAAIGGGGFHLLLWAAFFEFNFATVFLFLGIVGDQVRLIAERGRHTPLVVEKERVNFTPPQ